MARLAFQNGAFAGKTLPLPSGKPFVIGRNRDLELPLPDLKLSRRHCVIEGQNERYVVRDLESTNGTFVNGKQVEGEVVLRHGDKLAVGDTEMEFQSPEPAKAAKTPPGGAARLDTPGRGTPAAPIEVTDPLLALLTDLDRPLPPEPPAPPPPKQTTPILFCDACQGSIPSLDVDLGIARCVDGKVFCRECLAKGAAAKAHTASDVDLDRILTGLNQVEEITVEDEGKQAEGGAPAKGAGPRGGGSAGDDLVEIG